MLNCYADSLLDIIKLVESVGNINQSRFIPYEALSVYRRSGRRRRARRRHCQIVQHCCSISKRENMCLKSTTRRLLGGLILQDLTYIDIQNYVAGRPLKDDKMKTLYINEPIRAPELVRDIVAIANRVFL